MSHLYHDPTLGCGSNVWTALDPPSSHEATSIALDPTTSTDLFEATSTGVNLCTGCAGAHATPGISPLGTGLPPVWVNSVTISHDDKNLIAWTYGRGAWTLDLAR
jgi:hypothetical protein